MLLILKLSLQIVVIIETSQEEVIKEKGIKEEGIKATSITPTITGNVILVLYARNPTAVYRSIYWRNKRQKRLDLRLGTLVGLVAKPATLITSINTLIEHIYSI